MQVGYSWNCSYHNLAGFGAFQTRHWWHSYKGLYLYSTLKRTKNPFMVVRWDPSRSSLASLGPSFHVWKLKEQNPGVEISGLHCFWCINIIVSLSLNFLILYRHTHTFSAGKQGSNTSSIMFDTKTFIHST